MEFVTKIQGFGNIAHGQFEIKNLTVFAGENSSGKTFVTKNIYSILEALNHDYFSLELERLIQSFVLRYMALQGECTEQNIDIEELVDYVDNQVIPLLENILKESVTCHISDQPGLAETFSDALENINLFFKKSDIELSQLESLQSQISNIKNLLNNFHDSVVKKISKQLSDNFKKNFQVTSLGDLINTKCDQALIDIDTVGEAKIDAENRLIFNFTTDGIAEIRKLNNVVFIDSPAYLKIRKGLQRRQSLFWKRDPKQLYGYPEYLDNLFSYLDVQFIDDAELGIIAEKIRNEISGQLTVTKAGDIQFKSDKNETIPLSLMAMGISNLGLIELLLRNNTIRKGSFLIIDEPEAHLHPKWQVLLMEVLYEIAKAGANVIIATHSLDMLKKLEVLIKQDKQATEIVSVHKMPDPESQSGMSLLGKVEDIITDLSSPFYNLYMKDLNL